jgi:hypothetical protein
MKKPEYAKISDHEQLIRDMKSNAVLNTDLTSLEKYRIKREKDRQMSKDIDTLKSEMSEIKNLLHQLVNRD